MRESQFGFSYSFSDLWQVPVLTSAVLAGELIGAALGYFLLTSHGDGFARAWLGGVLGLIPGYPLGLLLQWKLQPERLAENAVMVRRLGLIAACLISVALCMWLADAS
ncbi:hypothetical protein A7A76_20145 [Lysobacter enzymogenes]|uniref:hypothetical protein n=1 Tax=Lysobacter enzymogenes TaxID=69 RepID=UPI0019D06D35|nr:hypothetical protein [Lysobacter enzymogenes]MBN7137051.1 hypothetical protein [Lysobacter enzymogenes]